MTQSAQTLVLASTSQSRLSMLRAAGIAVEALSPGLDEDPIKDGLRAEGVGARDLADALAEAKAMKVSRRIPDALVLGGDQILQLDDGTQLDKAVDADDAKAQLARMAGRTHRLITAAVIAEAARPVWRHIDIATLTMRPMHDAFIDAYVDAHWDAIRHCVGCYQIERAGAQLFSRIEGSQFTIMGLPLLALCDYLRIRGYLPT